MLSLSLLFSLLLGAYNFDCVVVFCPTFLTFLWARPRLVLRKVDLVSTRWSRLHCLPSFFLLVRFAILVAALCTFLDREASALVKRFLVNTHIGWVKVLAATLTRNFESTNLGLVEVNFRRLFDHVGKVRQKDLRERRAKVWSIEVHRLLNAAFSPWL